MHTLGIDIGGTGIKGAIIDTASGEFASDRYRADTPQPATREAVSATLKEVLTHFQWTGPVGFGFPGVVKNDVVFSCPNLHPSLIGTNLSQLAVSLGAFEAHAINDADAAGLAEMRLGAGRNAMGNTLMVTIGTGIGTALFHKGKIVPNMELGSITWRGMVAEHLVSERARETLDLSWKKWAKDFNAYLEYLSSLLTLDLIILGGGGAKKREKFEEFLTLETPYTFADFGNRAGILGAALAING